MSLLFSAATIRLIHVFSSAFSAFLSANILRPRVQRSCNPWSTLRASVTVGTVTVPKKYSPSGDFEPLEFINNQWFGLFGHPETSTTHLCTRASAAIPVINRLSIGYWDITDPEHPDFTPGTIETIDVDPPEDTQPHTPSTVTIYTNHPKNTPAPHTHYSSPTPRLTIASTSTITFPTAPSPTIIPTQYTPSQPTITMSASATGGRSGGGGGGGGGGAAPAAAAAPAPSNGGM